MDTVLLITIDAEGDNHWARPREIRTENAAYVPRFHELCGRFGFRPTYLVNYEMARDPRFQAFGRALVRGGTGEIGLHVHPWNSPPLFDRYDAGGHYLYLYEYPPELMHAKMEGLARMLSDLFETPIVSHRAGRWGFDEAVARALIELGFLTDCSVTPGVSHRKYRGAPDGRGGPDFFGFPLAPYYIDPSDIRRKGASPLLEVPVTIRSNYSRGMEKIHHRYYEGVPGKLLRRIAGPPHTWLRPNGRNEARVLALVDWALENGLPVLEFILHSSELMPGGSPWFGRSEEIERLYVFLELLFGRMAARGIRGETLAEFRHRFDERQANRAGGVG